MSVLELSGRVALVTGGSRGIGRATVERLIEAGAEVAFSFAQNEKAAANIVGWGKERGRDVLAVRGDVARLEDARKLVGTTIEKFKRLDILVCNAGVWEGAPVDELSEELWDRVIAVNLRGTWTACRAAVPYMKKQGSGRIVIVSSTAGQRGEANVSNYAASKGGQISFTKSLAVELAPYNINVNAVAPGWVETEMNTEVFRDERFRRSVLAGIPVGRMATADDIARPILFLCSDWARHITGEVLNINGGAVLCG